MSRALLEQVNLSVQAIELLLVSSHKLLLLEGHLARALLKLVLQHEGLLPLLASMVGDEVPPIELLLETADDLSEMADVALETAGVVFLLLTGMKPTQTGVSKSSQWELGGEEKAVRQGKGLTYAASRLRRSRFCTLSVLSSSSLFSRLARSIKASTLFRLRSSGMSIFAFFFRKPSWRSAKL